MSNASVTDRPHGLAALWATRTPSLRQHLVGGKIPLWRLLAIVAAAGGALPAARPLRDLDIWWHVRLGYLIRQNGVPQHELWSYPILGDPWHPTAWLTDVLFSVLHEAGGWRAIVVYKVLASAGILVMLYRQVVPRARAEITAPVFVIALASISMFFGERPQLLSFLLVLTIGPWAVRLSTTGEWRAWPWVAITYLWCNLHGMWVLGPALLGLAAVSWTVQSGFSRGSPAHAHARCRCRSRGDPHDDCDPRRAGTDAAAARGARHRTRTQ